MTRWKNGRKGKKMRIPDGYISILHSNDKGTEATVEQRELVLCKHCRHYEADFGNDWGMCCHPDWSTRTLGFEVSEDGFCHRAERREGDGR